MYTGRFLLGVITLDLYNYQPPDSGGEAKRELTRDCLRLGAMLIGYRILNYLTIYLIYPITYYVLSGKLKGYSGAAKGLKEDYSDLLKTTAFRMMMNSAITVSSLLLIIAFGYVVLGFSFKGFLKPSQDGAKKGAFFFPACFMLNIIMSTLVNYFVGIMGSVGVTIPEADFTIKTPSAASVAFQFLYLAVIAPLVEETIYRGMILSSLSKYSETAAIFFSALCFGLMHGNIPQAVSAFGTGLAYASIAMSSRSILPSLIIHSLNNMLVAMSEIGNALNVPHIDTVTSIFQVIVAVIGIYLLFTRYTYFRNDRSEALSPKGETVRVIYKNPVIITYLCIMVISILLDIIDNNV